MNSVISKEATVKLLLSAIYNSSGYQFLHEQEVRQKSGKVERVGNLQGNIILNLHRGCFGLRELVA